MAWRRRSGDGRPWRTGCRGRRRGPGPGVLLAAALCSLWVPLGAKGQALFVCDFERFNKCGMEEVQVQGQDQFDWTIGQDRTPSGALHINDGQATGPTGGQGNSRYYIFIEASDPRLPNDTARLLTPAINYQGEICLDFYYHMLGADVGSLAIYVQPDSVVRNLSPVWSQSNSMGPNWFRVRLTSRLDRPGGRIEFRGTRGGFRSALGWSGDLAFDTIQVLGGRCEGDTSPTAGPPPTNEGPPTFPPTPPTEDPIPQEGNEVTLPFVCDFETSLCGLRGPGNANGIFDWTRQTGSTPTTGTGPTRAFNGQWYIYVEASEPRQGGDRFILQTLPIRFNGDACVSFAYHMYGPHVNNFFISVLGNNRPTRNFFSLTGDQGNAWRQAAADVRINFFDTIFFEVTRGSGIMGDVALDNLRIDPAPCSNVATPPPVTPRPTPFPTQGPTLPGGLRRLPWQCGFEQDVCGMQQPITDRFDWTRNVQSTPTVGTGPDSARSGSYYIYTEASDPRTPGDIALLVTPMFDTQGAVCVEFFYHMFGSGMGTLRVYVTRFGPSFRVFEINGNQGNQWRFERVNVPNFNYGDQITFQSTRGQSYTSDMALDDITIYPGSCSGGVPTPVPPVTPRPTQGPPTSGDVFSCNMEDPRLTNQANCRLRQDTREDQLDWTRTSGKTPSGALYSRRYPNGLFPVTGPDGAREGNFYLYIEASGKPRGLVARLFIEGNDVRRGGNGCLRFYYSLNGFHMGSLRIFTRVGGGARLTKWSLAGDQGTSWQGAVVDVDMSGLSELGFEATTLGEFSGDVAVDEVRIQPGNCESTPSQYVFLCNFETGGGLSTICGMEQDRNDRFDWTLQRGPTPSQVTGPDRAFSGSYFMFIEASRPRVRGDFAVLLTPPITWNGDMCVEFMYNMYGFHIGTLEVFSRDGFSADATQWSETGQRGQQWLQGRATITNFRSGSRIGFRGIRGAEYSGDIAIDSIMLRPGRC